MSRKPLGFKCKFRMVLRSKCYRIDKPQLERIGDWAVGVQIRRLNISFLLTTSSVDLEVGRV